MVSRSSARATERAAVLQHKRKTTDMVRARFARFGDEVLSIVLGFALKPKSVTVLLSRLEIKPTGGLETDLDRIWMYVAGAGAKDFLRKAKGLKIKQVQAAQIDDLVEDQPADQDDEPQRQPSAGGAAVNESGWNGVERRTGKDRRSGSDRRHLLEAINKNQRFGGDRRAKGRRGRRKSDY